MRGLHVSDKLTLPLEWMMLATVVYGARGSGKTTLGSVIAEELHKAGQRFVAVDLKGDFYGLKSSADGKNPGIPVVVFGGDHQDVPLEEGAGAFIGETIAQLEQPAILDLEHLSKGKQVRFLAAFFERLYDRNRDPLLLLLDEAQRYAPQKPFDPDAAKCLGAVEDLVKLGRKHGIGPMLFTQRGSGLNKEVSELCDMLVAFRTPGPLDQDRVKGWLEANVTKEQQQAVMASLSGLATGTAVFASGHPDLKIFGTYAVRRRETFDSSATPKVGQRRKEPKQLAKPDLEDLRQRMADAIERQKADDPKALRALLKERDVRIHELERKHSAEISRATQAPPKVERVEVPVLKNGTTKALTKAAADLASAAGRLESSAQLIGQAAVRVLEASRPVVDGLRRIQHTPTGGAVAQQGVAAAPPVRAAASRPVPDSAATTRQPGERPNLPVGQPTHRAGGPAAHTEGITGPQQRILDALAVLEQLGLSPASKVQLALFAHASPSSSAYANNLGALRSAAHIEYPRGGFVGLTDGGRAIANAAAAPSTVDELHRFVERLVSGPQWRILRALIDAYPYAIAKEDLAAAAEASATSSAFANNLGALRSLGLIDYPRPGRVAALPVLFMEGRP